MNEKQKIILVNTNSDLVSSLRDRFSVHIDKFDKFRILSACESCEEIVPKILNSMMNETEKDTKKSTS